MRLHHCQWTVNIYHNSHHGCYLAVKIVSNVLKKAQGRKFEKEKTYDVGSQKNRFQPTIHFMEQRPNFIHTKFSYICSVDKHHYNA